MIDPQTGSLTLSQTVQINPGDSIDRITAVNFGVAQVLNDMQTGWKWLTVKNVVVETNYYMISFGFYHDVLLQLSLVVAAAQFDLNPRWESWSEADEHHTLTRLRQWVHAELGRDGVFGWGRVRVDYDPKGGASSICITYTA